MADLTKIYRGMQNGAETINNNFNKLNAASVTFGRTSQAPWATSYFSSGQLNFTRIGSLVFIMGWANTNSIPAGTTPASPVPSGFKPKASLGAVRLVTTEGHKYELGTDGNLTFKTVITAGNSFTPMTACFITDDDFPS